MRSAAGATPVRARPHSTTARLIHWGSIGVFAYALSKQLDELDELQDHALLQSEMVFAGFFLLLLIARFVYMQTTRPSALPTNTPRRERQLARAGHLALYGAIAIIALSGLVIGTLYSAGHRTSFAMETALLTHEVAVNGSYFLIAGHVLAALYHRRKRDGIWNAMVPWWREPEEDRRGSER